MPIPNLNTFELSELAQFTKEGSFSENASPDHRLFFVGRDNVHEILKYIFSRITVSLTLSMFGYDDDELNQIVMQKVLDPNVLVIITLDKSQAGGVHEKLLLDADRKQNLASFNTHFVIGQSSTGQINHTKGWVADNKIAGEGSTNWSDGGEGVFTVKGVPGKAQNNTQSVIIDPDTVTRFSAQIIAEHLAAQERLKPTPTGSK